MRSEKSNNHIPSQNEDIDHDQRDVTKEIANGLSGSDDRHATPFQLTEWEEVFEAAFSDGESFCFDGPLGAPPRENSEYSLKEVLVGAFVGDGSDDWRNIFADAFQASQLNNREEVSEPQGYAQPRPSSNSEIPPWSPFIESRPGYRTSIKINPFGLIDGIISDVAMFQDNLDSFFSIPDKILSDIRFFSEAHRFSDFSEFNFVKYPACGIYGAEEHLDVLLYSSFDVLICTAGDLLTFNQLIPAFLSVLKDNCAWSADVGNIRDEITPTIPQEIINARIGWLSSLPYLAADGSRTIKELTSSDEPAISDLYAIKKVVRSFSAYGDNIHSKTLAELFIEPFLMGHDYVHAFAFDILIGRKGLLIGKKATLQELANQLGITRERVRQIEKRYSGDVDLATAESIFYWRVATAGAALRMGGGGDTHKLKKLLKETISIYKTEPLLGPLLLSPDLVIQKNENLFHYVELPCVKCVSAEQELSRISKERDFLDIEKVRKSIGCRTECFGGSPSIGAFQSIFGEKYQLLSFGHEIGSRDSLVVKARRAPNSTRALILATMFELGKPATVKEISIIVSGAAGKRVTPGTVTSHLGPYNDCYMTGNSTYLHKRFFPMPAALLNDVLNFLVDSFKSNSIPILHIDGAYTLFENALLDEGISSRHMLFSCLRILEDSQLKLQEYPWVCDAVSIGERTTFAKYIYSVIAKNNGAITDSYARELAINAQTQERQLDGLATYSKYVIKVDGWWYDLEHLDVNYDGIEKLIEEAALEVADGDFISATKIFADNLSLCHRLGVKSAEVLFRAIDLLESTPLKAGTVPYLIKTKISKGISAKEEIRNYIRTSGYEVSQAELDEEFVIKRGVRKSTVSPAMFLGAGVIRTGIDLYAGEEFIGIGEREVELFDLAVSAILQNREAILNIFYQIRHILQSRENLPEIGNISWTRELLEFAFYKSKLFRLLGKDKSCIISDAEAPGILDDEDLYVSIIERHFSGWAIFDDFVKYLETYQIGNDLDSEFFDRYELIEASRTSIKTLNRY